MPYRLLTKLWSNQEDQVEEKKKGHPGGQQGTPPVMIVENNCLGELPDCSGESNNPFRRIDGTCNNLGGSRSKRELRRSGGGRRGGGRNGGGRGGGGSRNGSNG